MWVDYILIVMFSCYWVWIIKNNQLFFCMQIDTMGKSIYNQQLRLCRKLKYNRLYYMFFCKWMTLMFSVRWLIVEFTERNKISGVSFGFFVVCSSSESLISWSCETVADGWSVFDSGCEEVLPPIAIESGGWKTLETSWCWIELVCLYKASILRCRGVAGKNYIGGAVCSARSAPQNFVSLINIHERRVK